MRGLDIRSGAVEVCVEGNCVIGARSFRGSLHPQFVPLHDMQASLRNRGITPLFLRLGTRWRGVVNLTPRPISPWSKNLGIRRIECCPETSSTHWRKAMSQN